MSRRVTLCLSVLACALPASAATAYATPVVKSVSPLSLKVGQKLTIKGTGFRAGTGKTRVFFLQVGGKGSTWALSMKGSTTRTVKVTVPAKLNGLLSGGKAARFHLRVLAHTFGKITATKLSPLIAPSATGGSGSGSSSGSGSGSGAANCMPGGVASSSNDSDADGLNDLLETQIGTDPCNKDTDGDGVPDGYEYYSAVDLNSTTLHGSTPTPYPAKRPYPNALYPDATVDYDGDGLTQADEYALWNKFGDHHFPLTSYSDGKQMTLAVPAPASEPWLDMNGDGWLNDGEQDADGDGLGNWDESHGRMTRDWWGAQYDGSSRDGCGIQAKENAYPVAYAGTDMLNSDSDGDGIPDGLDDQDHDGLSNIFELVRPGTATGVPGPCWGTTYVSGPPSPSSHNYDPNTNSLVDPPGATADPYSRVNPFDPCKPIYSQTCWVHPAFGYYGATEDWAFPYAYMPLVPNPGPTP